MLSQDTVVPHRLHTYIFVFPHENYSSLRPKQMWNLPDVSFDTKIMCMTMCSGVVLHTHRSFRSDFCAFIYRALKELDHDQSKCASGSRQPNPDAKNRSGRLDPFLCFGKMCPICSYKDPIPAAIGLACIRNSARNLLPRGWWSQQAKALRVDSGDGTHLTCWSIEAELSIFSLDLTWKWQRWDLWHMTGFEFSDVVLTWYWCASKKLGCYHFKGTWCPNSQHQRCSCFRELA